MILFADDPNGDLNVSLLDPGEHGWSRVTFPPAEPESSACSTRRARATKSVNVFLFGGSFNPPHVAHVLAVSYLLATEDINRILVIPCFLHPFGKELAPFEDRMAMSEAAMGWLPRTIISRVEEELGGQSRTLRTVEHLHSLHPDWKMRLVVGGDILLEGRRWHGFERVVELSPLLVLGRRGFEPSGAPEAALARSVEHRHPRRDSRRTPRERSNLSCRATFFRTSTSIGSTVKAPELRVFIIGAGKVGTSLSRALSRARRQGDPASRSFGPSQVAASRGNC